MPRSSFTPNTVPLEVLGVTEQLQADLRRHVGGRGTRSPGGPPIELGGKSAAIILEDADVDAILPTLVGISVGTSQRQSCVCMSRFLAPRSRYDEIASKLSNAFSSLKVGDPFEQDTVIGPVVSKEHQERVLGYVRKGVEESATVATGGKAPEGLEHGYYVEPTLLTNVTNDMTVAQEEIFGPVIVLIPFDDEDDAVRIANESKYGLADCVFTSDTAHGFEIARRIRTGTFSVNTFAADFNSPFGGFKESGIGREHGREAIEEYLRPQDHLSRPRHRAAERGGRVDESRAGTGVGTQAVPRPAADGGGRAGATPAMRQAPDAVVHGRHEQADLQGGDCPAAGGGVARAGHLFLRKTEFMSSSRRLAGAVDTARGVNP
jgi:hypothetical protein